MMLSFCLKNVVFAPFDRLRAKVEGGTLSPAQAGIQRHMLINQGAVSGLRPAPERRKGNYAMPVYLGAHPLRSM